LTLKRYLSVGHVAIVPRGSIRGGVDDLLAQEGRARRVALETPNFVGVPLLVAGSELLATIPEGLYRSARAIMPLDASAPPFRMPSTDLYMAWHERMQNDSAHVWLRELVRSVTGGAATEASSS
jgi:DNA-binding transcriptional LysR family regulator